MHGARTTLAIASGLLTACAQISATTEIRTLPVPGARPVATAPRVVERQLEVRWTQVGSVLSLELLEHRKCARAEHVSVVREETTVRRADAAIYWEYGAAAVLLGLAAFSFARPELFAVSVPEDNLVRRPARTGRLLGASFAALGSAALGAGIYDSVRARDTVTRTPAVLVRYGPVAACDDDPVVPASQRPLALLFGEHSDHAITDLHGHASFVLPHFVVRDDASATGSATVKIGANVGHERLVRLDVHTISDPAEVHHGTAWSTAR